MQQSMQSQSQFGGVFDFFGDIVEGGSKVPGILRDTADDISNFYRDIESDFNREKQETVSAVEDNIRQDQIKQYGSRAATWLSKPANLLVAFGGIILLLILVRR